MTIDSLVDHPALGWYRSRPRDGYSLVTGEPSAAILGATSRLGGFPFLPTTERWPVCSQCGTALFFVGQFGRDLQPLLLPNDVDILSVFKCGNLDCDNWPAGYHGAEFFRLFNTAITTSLQSPESQWDFKSVYPPPGIVFDRFGPASPSIAAEVGVPFSLRIGERFTDFPGWEENDSWRQIDDPVFDKYLERYPVAGAKLLGHPKWEQGSGYPRCCCGNTMQHLIQLESPEVQLGDCGRMHVFHCQDWCCGSESLAVSWACG